MHVGKYVVDRGHLVGRLFVGEGRLEFLEYRIALRKGEARRELAGGVEREELAGHVAQRGLDLALRLLPGLAAELVDPRLDTVGGAVALDAREAVDGEEKLVPAEVLDREQLALGATRRQLLESAVDADAVVDMDEVVAGGELRDPVELLPVPPAGARTAPFSDSEDLLVAHDRERLVRPDEPLAPDVDHAQLEAPRKRPMPDRPRIRRDLGLELIVGK